MVEDLQRNLALAPSLFCRHRLERWEVADDIRPGREAQVISEESRYAFAYGVDSRR